MLGDWLTYEVSCLPIAKLRDVRRQLPPSPLKCLLSANPCMPNDVIFPLQYLMSRALMPFVAQGKCCNIDWSLPNANSISLCFKWIVHLNIKQYMLTKNIWYSRFKTMCCPLLATYLCLKATLLKLLLKTGRSILWRWSTFLVVQKRKIYERTMSCSVKNASISTKYA